MRLSNEIIDEVIALLAEGSFSKREIARRTLGKESRESTVRHIEKTYGTSSLTSFSSIANQEKITAGIRKDYDKARILFIDIETAPLRAHLWSMWQHGVGLNQIESDWYMLSFTAKWADSDEIIYMDLRDSPGSEDDYQLLEKIWHLFDEADFVVGHNTKKFDVKKINARFLLNGFTRPSTFRHIDTLLIAKSLFGFTSNKLEYLTDKLCTTFKKSTHKKFPGHMLWVECLKGNPEAWEEMEEYNKFDVLSNQELYEIFMPWDSKLPNFDLYVDAPLDMSEWVEDGFHTTNLGKYQRYRHVVTGQQRRGRKNLLSPEKRETLLANIVS